MIGYASRTGTRTTVRALHDAGWRQLLAPGQSPTCARGWMLDNGAWSLHENGRTWDDTAGRAYLRHLVRWGRHADFVVAPDIVAGGLASLELSANWMATCLLNCAVVLVAVQDGMTPADVRPVIRAVTEVRSRPLGRDVSRRGIFLGGSTPWKLATAMQWGEVARSLNCWLHVGRVNSATRIDLCRAAGADSFDGKSAVLFPSTLPLLDRARRQVGLLQRPGHWRAPIVPSRPAE